MDRSTTIEELYTPMDSSRGPVPRPPGSQFGEFLLAEFRRCGWRSVNMAADKMKINRGRLRRLIEQGRPDLDILFAEELARKLGRPSLYIINAYREVFGTRSDPKDPADDAYVQELIEFLQHEPEHRAILERLLRARPHVQRTVARLVRLALESGEDRPLET